MDFKKLCGYRNRIESLQDRIQNIRSTLELAAYKFRNMPKQQAYRDKLADGISKLLELEIQLLEEVHSFETEVQIMEWEISSLPVQQQQVVRLHYVHKMGYKEIAALVHYTPEHCRKIALVARRKLNNDEVDTH